MSAELLNLMIPGRPRTKGSLKPMHIRGSGGRPCKIGLTEDHALSKPWMQKMIRAMRAEYRGGIPFLGAVVVQASFGFEREISIQMAAAGAVIPSHNTPWPTAIGIGDLDKLTRSVLDALTQSGVIADDCLVVAADVRKQWVSSLAGGVLVRVASVDAPEPWSL